MKNLRKILSALLGPTLVLGLLSLWALRPPPWEPNTFVKNLDAQIAKNKPEVVILGSSWAYTNIAPETFAQAMALQPSDVMRLYQAGSHPAVWYTLLKYRLYGSEVRPKLIILLGSESVLLWQKPHYFSQIEQHFAEPDDVLLRKAWKKSSSVKWTQILGRRAQLRDGLLAGLRALMVQLLAGVPEGKTLEDVQSEASTKVFAGMEVKQGGGRILPVVEESHEVAPDTSDETPKESLLWDMTDLAAANGAKMVVVLPPVASFFPENQALGTEDEAAMIAEANARHVGWIDLRRFPMEDRLFMSDGGHMRTEGAQIFSSELAKNLEALGAFREGPLQPATLPAHIESLTRQGTISTYPNPFKIVPFRDCLWRIDLGAWSAYTAIELSKQLGLVASPVQATLEGKTLPLSLMKDESCGAGFYFNGAKSLIRLPKGTDTTSLVVGFNPAPPTSDANGIDGYWVFPGSSLEWTLSGLPAGEVQVETVLRSVGPGTEAPLLSLDTQTTTLQPGDKGLEASATWHIAEGNHVVRLTVPADGPLVLLRQLAVDAGTQHTVLVVQPTTHPLDVFAGPIQAGEAMPMPMTLKTEGNHSYFEVPWRAEGEFSPLQVLEDGKLMKPIFAAGVHLKPGESRHLHDRVEVQPSDDAPHQYSLRLDPERYCCNPSRRVQHWIYPGDQLSASIKLPIKVNGLGAIHALYLVGAPLDEQVTAPQLHLIARYQGAVVLEQAVDTHTLSDGIYLGLQQFIPRGPTESLEIEVQLPVDAQPVRLGITAIPM